MFWVSWIVAATIMVQLPSWLFTRKLIYMNCCSATSLSWRRRLGLTKPSKNFERWKTGKLREAFHARLLQKWLIGRRLWLVSTRRWYFRNSCAAPLTFTWLEALDFSISQLERPWKPFSEQAEPAFWGFWPRLDSPESAHVQKLHMQLNEDSSRP